MNIFRRSIIRMGNATYHAAEDGQWHNLGNIAGKGLVALAVKMGLPVVHVVVDPVTLPQSNQLLRSNLPFVFNQQKVGLGTNWPKAPLA